MSLRRRAGRRPHPLEVVEFGEGRAGDSPLHCLGSQIRLAIERFEQSVKCPAGVIERVPRAESSPVASCLGAPVGPRRRAVER